MAKKNKRANNWSLPRQATTGQKIIAAFREHGMLTIGQAAQRTGIHPMRIRAIVRPPTFEEAGLAGEGRGKSVLWRLRKLPTP